EQIYQTELNTDKAIPLIPQIVVDNYIPLMGKKVKGDTFCLYHPNMMNKTIDIFGVTKIIAYIC
ncbi:MAG TPA: hypothetical protein P5331_06920, partial [Candidatus Syntrophosphaera sp.]|nr:hypothetical protein [Candidatus Syntrophosphaera sp.]